MQCYITCSAKFIDALCFVDVSPFILDSENQYESSSKISMSITHAGVLTSCSATSIRS